MKAIKSDAREYRTPVCKLVPVHIEGLMCSSPESMFGNTLDDAEEEDLGTL